MLKVGQGRDRIARASDAGCSTSPDRRLEAQAAKPLLVVKHMTLQLEVSLNLGHRLKTAADGLENHAFIVLLPTIAGWVVSSLGLLYDCVI